MIAVKPPHERRKDPRLTNNIPVKICQEDGDLVAETQNISRSGVYCHVDKYIAPMTKLRVHLLLSSSESGKKKSRKVSLNGVVVRSEPVLEGAGYHVAIFFNEVSKRDADFITDYVSLHLNKSEEN